MNKTLTVSRESALAILMACGITPDRAARIVKDAEKLSDNAFTNVILSAIGL